MRRRAIHEELLGQLQRRVSDLASSSSWLCYLDMQRRFHHYSANNVLLILAQRPSATQVAGYRAWQRLGRHVRRGERAILVLAPVFYPKSTSGDEDAREVRGFRWVAVFDVAQTDGPALPAVCHALEGTDDQALFDRLVGVAHHLGFVVQDHRFPDATHGDCHHDLKRIRVRENDAPAQRVKSLAHEIAHGILHRHFESRALAELEAESVAYMVCASFGLDTESYSVGYVVSWSGGGEAANAAIEVCASRIQGAFGQIIELLEPLSGCESDGVGVAMSSEAGNGASQATVASLDREPDPSSS